MPTLPFPLAFAGGFGITGPICTGCAFLVVSRMKLMFALLVVLAGICTSIQTGMNAQVRLALGHATTAAMVNFMVGFLALFSVITLFRIPLPSWSAVGSVPVWAWFGGCLGAFLIGTLALSAHELGGAAIVALLVTGQLLAALVLDHYGWLGFPVRSLTLARVVGSALIVIGLILFKES